MSTHDEAPIGVDWEKLVLHFVGVHGSWAGLADELVRRVGLGGREAVEPAAAQKGLRRLASRRNSSGGQYGGWMLRLFGLPRDVERQLQWFAQYHSRFSDLPTSVRRDQLRLWDRPPTSESRLVAWVHLGLASVHHRRREQDRCAQRLAAARRSAPAAGAMAQLEALLLAARMQTDRTDIAGAVPLLDEAENLIDDASPEHIPYRARLNGQRAYGLTRAEDRSPEAHEQARALFEQIPADSGIAFVDYRRTAGLAYCAWRLGDVAEGQRLARAAAEHAGDGGYVRFRVMALNLLARMADPADAAALRARAARLARSIEDFHLEKVARIRDDR